MEKATDLTATTATTIESRGSGGDDISESHDGAVMRNDETSSDGHNVTSSDGHDVTSSESHNVTSSDGYDVNRSDIRDLARSYSHDVVDGVRMRGPHFRALAAEYEFNAVHPSSASNTGSAGKEGSYSAVGLLRNCYATVTVDYRETNDNRAVSDIRVTSVMSSSSSLFSDMDDVSNVEVMLSSGVLDVNERFGGPMENRTVLHELVTHFRFNEQQQKQQQQNEQRDSLTSSKDGDVSKTRTGSDGSLTVDDDIVVRFASIVSLLTRHGAEINGGDARRQTPLHLLVSHPTADRSRAIRALLANGAKVNASDNIQQTALHVAASRGNVANVRALLDGGADPYEQNHAGQTALHCAVKGTSSRFLKTVQTLIYCHANVNQVDVGGSSPLHVAAKSGRAELVKELMCPRGDGSGTRVNVANGSGQTAVHLAAAHDCSGGSLKELLTAKAADINVQDSLRRETPLHKAIRHEMHTNIQILARFHPDVSITDFTGDTVIHAAAERLTDLKSWSTLLKIRGASEALGRVNNEGLTALGVADRAKNRISHLVLVSQMERVEEAGTPGVMGAAGSWAGGGVHVQGAIIGMGTHGLMGGMGAHGLMGVVSQPRSASTTSV